MKVQKVPPKHKQKSRKAARQHCKLQCNTKWFKQNRIGNTDSSNLSPGTAMAKLEHQASSKQKSNLKRLKKAAKTVCFRQVKGQATERTPSHALSNGGAEREQGGDSDDSQDWSSFAQSVLQNGAQSRDAMEGSVSAKAAPGRIEEEAFHYCAERDHVHNRTVLVMQQSQVCRLFRLHDNSSLFFPTNTPSLSPFFYCYAISPLLLTLC